MSHQYVFIPVLYTFKDRIVKKLDSKENHLSNGKIKGNKYIKGMEHNCHNPLNTWTFEGLLIYRKLSETV